MGWRRCALGATARLLGLLSCLCTSLPVARAIPSVPVTSVSLTDVAANRGDSVTQLLAALETHGLVALRDVPAYGETRARLLDVATQCVYSRETVAGVQTTTLRDGTTRRTISTPSKLHEPARATSRVGAACPQYLPELRAFSELLNVVAGRLAKAIDRALVGSASHLQTDQLEEIVRTAYHLDHFHAYASPGSDATSSPKVEDDEPQTDAALSLDLHTDNGVMILMTAPEFYALRGTRPPERVSRDEITSGPQASAGLLIKQPRQQHVVQPVIKDDELIVMIGEGYKAWMYSTLDFKPVLHGMQMPQFSPKYGQISRSWFGKMILLPRKHTIKNLGITFEEYSARATKYVLNHKGTEAFSAVACPPHSKLVESDKACTLKLFEPLADSRASRDECTSLCNTHAGDECQALCKYVATVPSGGVDCWMLCLPSDVCASNEIAKCDPSGKQQTVCVPATSL